MQDLLVEKHQGVERLILGRCRDMLVGGQMAQERGNLGGSEVLWMTPSSATDGAGLPVMSEEPDNPSPIGQFRPSSIVMKSHDFMNLFLQ